jgi:hypothetical protein
MKKNLLTAALLLLTLLTGISCKKNLYYNIPPDSLEGTGTLRNTGVPALDGCGWILKIGDTDYSPDNLPMDFKINNINVKVIYTVSDTKMICGNIAIGPNFIHLYDIKR